MENALKYFLRRCKDLKVCLDTCRDKEGLEKAIAHNEKAVEALEKQYAKKLIWSPDCEMCEKDGTPDCSNKCGSYGTAHSVLVCPNCKIGRPDCNSGRQPDKYKIYCSYCGQYIDLKCNDDD